MAKARALVVTVVFVVCAAASSLAPAGDRDDSFYRQQVIEAWTASQAGDHARADPLLEQVIGDARFAGLPEQERRLLLSSAGWSAANSGRIDVAAARYAQVTQMGSDDPDDWYRLALVSLDMDDQEAAARAMTVLVARWPELLVNLNPDIVYPLALHGDTGTPERIAFQQALFDANWKGGSTGTPGGIWFQLARTHLAQGDIDRARIVARRITDPETLVRMRADRRFDSLLDPDSWRANVSLASTREIERMRLLVMSHPDQLDALTSLAHQLAVGGQHAEVVALVDDTVAKIASAPLDAPPFTDLHRQVWLMNYKSIALRRMGRIDEAVGTLRQASRLGENGYTNVSQALNLGSLECDRGEPEAALAAADSAGEAISPYGRAVRAAIRQCAALQLGDQAMAHAALEELAQLADDAPMRYLEALLLAGRPDEAARWLATQLDAGDRRDDALGWAQDCRKPDALPLQVRERALKQAFLARDDVLAAIDAVGRIERYDIYCQVGG